MHYLLTKPGAAIHNTGTHTKLISAHILNSLSRLILHILASFIFHSNHAGLVPRQVTTAATEEGTFALTLSVEGQWTRSPHKTGPHICSTPWRTFCLQSTAAREHLQTVVATNRSDP